MGEAAELNIDIDESPAVFPDETDQGEQPAEAEAPPAPEPEPEKQESEEDKREKALAKMAWEKRKAEREAKELKERLAKLEASQSQTAPPVVPDMPDPLSLTEDQLKWHVQERDKAVAAKAAYDAQQQLLQEQQQRMAQAEQERQLEALKKSVDAYSARAKQLGVMPEELQEAGSLVNQYGIHESLADMILHDDQGPLITKYLAQNVMELAELSQLSPVQAAVTIATVIKPKAAALKPKVSKAPEPPNPVRSGGVSLKEYGVDGATYE